MIDHANISLTLSTTVKKKFLVLQDPVSLQLHLLFSDVALLFSSHKVWPLYSYPLCDMVFYQSLSGLPADVKFPYILLLIHLLSPEVHHSLRKWLSPILVTRSAFWNLLFVSVVITDLAMQHIRVGYFVHSLMFIILQRQLRNFFSKYRPE